MSKNSSRESDTLDLIFKAYDVRGIYPEQIDESVARRFGAAFAIFTQASSVVVARDVRPSGEALVEAFIAGATEVGVDVVDLGLASTDMVYFASGYLNAPAAVFTASHNPAEYNGIKCCRAGAAPIGEETGLLEIKAMMRTGQDQTSKKRGQVESRDLLSEFVSHVHSFVDLSVLKPLRVIADTANGIGGLIVPAVFAALPFELTTLFSELDGTFPNHPADPIQPENLVDLQSAILAEHADVGLAFDGDADRVFLVDDQANPVSGSITTAMVARSILERLPTEASEQDRTVVHNLICSKVVPEIVRQYDGTPIRTRVGHSFIKQVMAQSGAIFGGEHSGHYYFRDNYRADSGVIAALVVLETISRSGISLSELRTDFERYSASGEINSRVADPDAVMTAVSSAYPSATQDRVDGLTVDLGDWWFNLRPSNTEPLLRLNLEAANDEDCFRHTKEVLSLIEAH